MAKPQQDMNVQMVRNRAILEKIGLSMIVFEAFTTFVPTSYAQANEVRLAESRDLNLTFKMTKPDWCSHDVDVFVEGNRPVVTSEKYEKYQQTIGRLRSIITSECQDAERIKLMGDDDISRAEEATRAGRWRLIQLDSQTLEPACPNEYSEKTECNEIIRSYVFARDLLNRKELSDATMVTFLEFSNADHVQYKLGERMVGQIRELSERNGAISSLSPASLGNTISEQYRGKCELDGGESQKTSEITGDATTSMFVDQCKSKKYTEERAVFITINGDHRYFVSLSSKNIGREKLLESANRIYAELTSAQR